MIEALGREGRPEVGIGPFQPGQVRVADEASVVREMGFPGAMVEGVPVLVLGEQTSSEPPDFRGLLGWPYFRHFIVVFDGTAGSVTLTPHNDASVAPKGEFVRLGFDITPGEAGWVVTRLYEGSNAASVLRLGYVIESVDDEQTTGDRRAHVETLLSGYERGCEVEVRFRRGAESAAVRVEAEQLLPRFGG